MKSYNLKVGTKIIVTEGNPWKAVGTLGTIVEKRDGLEYDLRIIFDGDINPLYMKSGWVGLRYGPIELDNPEITRINNLEILLLC